MAAAEATAEYIREELLAAEQALEETEARILVVKNGVGAADGASTAAAEPAPLLTRLQHLDSRAENLLLAQDVAAYVMAFGCKSEEDDADGDMGRVEALLEILTRRNDATSAPLYQKLYRDEFVPLYSHVHANTVRALRRDLKQANYPGNCDELLQVGDEKQAAGSALAAIVGHCDVLQRLAAMRKHVVSHAEGTIAVTSAIDAVVQELCRPIVERIKFHFLLQSPDRPTSTRLERLPEWLLGYLRENVFQQDGGPWELIYYGLTPTHLALDFMNEMVRIVQWVLAERNFFRDPKIAGPASKPLWLCNAVEQLLQFDSFLKELVVDTGQSNRIISLVDVCIAGDEELLQWWLDRERESVVSALFDPDALVVMPGLTSRVSPRAELFCALIRSIQTKAAVFSFSGPYLSRVAVPICVRFLDAIHETATDLCKVLTQRKPLTDTQLQENIAAWVELINRAHMAATMLSAIGTTVGLDARAGNADHDLARFGRSLDRLQGVVLDDFVTTVLEVLLMERAKFAGYLMRCSHLLTCGVDQVVDAEKLTDISPDLFETNRILAIILDLCDGNYVHDDDSAPADNPYNYAPQKMRDALLSLIAEKLLEVALDLQGMTPDLLRPGCALFARDVNALFGEALLPKHALRVLDITKLMRMESPKLSGIGGALCGLSGLPAPLTEAIFEADDRLFEEAISMIRAQGLAYLELADVFAVLNRRRDL